MDDMQMEWRTRERLEPMWCDTTSVRHETQLTARCCAHSCRLCALWLFRVIVDGVLGVTIVVLIGLDEVRVVYVAIFVVIFCNWRCTLYTPRPVTVNCVGCYRYNHCKLCTKFFVRFMPQINRRFTDYHRFPLSISVKPIFVVRSHNRDATR